jgi:tetratricopeptide (TPR) repeat protein
MTNADQGIRRSGLPLLVALLATGLVHLTGIRGGLVYDDLLLVARNPLIVDLANVPTFFTTAYWDFMDPEEAARTGYWRPLTALVMSLSYQLDGPRPEVFHAVSVLLHLLATAVCVRVARLLGLAPLEAGAVGLLFGLHPVHVESVAWISAVGDPLFGALALGAVAAFLSWSERGSRGAPVLSLSLFAAALLAKELAVAALPLLLVLDLARGGGARGRAGLARAYGGYVLVLVLYWAARTAVFGDVLAGFDRTTTDLGVGPVRTALLVLELVGGAAWLLLWPAELSLFHATSPELPLTDAAFLRSAVLALGLLVASVALWRRGGRLLAVALIALPATLLPVLARAQGLGPFPLSERYLYLGVLGLALALVLASRALPRPAAIALVGLVALGHGLRSVVRVGDWSDERALFGSAAAVSPASAYVQWGLGRANLTAYRDSRDPLLLIDAERAFEEAGRLVGAAVAGDGRLHATQHDSRQARLGLAWCALYRAEREANGDFEPARDRFQEIANEDPTDATAFAGLGTTHYLLGDLGEAESALRRSLGLDPKNAEAHHNLGRVLEKLARPEDAATHFAASLALRPGHVADLIALARMALLAGDVPLARERIAAARELSPDDPQVPYVEGLAEANEGRMESALERFEESKRLDPRYGPARLYLGQALIALGRADEAVPELETAALLLPDHFDAHYNLGALLDARGETDEALPHLVRAYELSSEPDLRANLRAALVPLLLGDLEELCELALLDGLRGDYQGMDTWLRLTEGLPGGEERRADVVEEVRQKSAD